MLASLVPRGLIFANQLWQKICMQVIIYFKLVLASISIVYTKDEFKCNSYYYKDP